MQECIDKIEAITNVKVLLRIQDAEKDADLKKSAVIIAICNKYNVTWNKIKSMRRDADIIRARHAYIYIATVYLRQEMGKTAADIGKWNHSNISHTVKKVKGYFDVKEPESLVIQSIIDKLKL